VRPGPGVLRISQDRIDEKGFLKRHRRAEAPWRPVRSLAELQAAAAALGLPAILKTVRLGYDGKGQILLRGADELEAAYEELEPKPLILEGFVDFACEVSVIVAARQTAPSPLSMQWEPPRPHISISPGTGRHPRGDRRAAGCTGPVASPPGSTWWAASGGTCSSPADNRVL